MNQPKPKSFVKVSIGDGKDHPIIPLIESKDPPELKAVGIMRVPNKNTFVSYTMVTKGDKVLSIEMEEPNLRAIAEDSAKIAFVSMFCHEDLH